MGTYDVSDLRKFVKLMDELRERDLFVLMKDGAISGEWDFMGFSFVDKDELEVTVKFAGDGVELLTRLKKTYEEFQEENVKYRPKFKNEDIRRDPHTF